MSLSGEIGRIGEQMVADYLRKSGYIILRRNFRSEFGEIDIIAETRDTVAFVEVKTRSHDFVVAPADAVDRSKQYKIAKTARAFLDRAYLVGACRFDIAEVVYRREKTGDIRFSLNYIKNAFTADLETDR